MAKMTVGERAINWSKAAVTIWPVIVGLLALLGWTNSDHIMRALSVPEPDGVTEVELGGLTFEDMVVKFTREMNARVDELEGRVEVQRADLSTSDRKNLQKLQGELHKLNERLVAVEELVN